MTVPSDVAAAVVLIGVLVAPFLTVAVIAWGVTRRADAAHRRRVRRINEWAASGVWDGMAATAGVTGATALRIAIAAAEDAANRDAEAAKADMGLAAGYTWLGAPVRGGMTLADVLDPPGLAEVEGDDGDD